VKEASKVGPPVSQDCETEMASEKRCLKSLSWYPPESTLAVEVKDRKAYSTTDHERPEDKMLEVVRRKGVGTFRPSYLIESVPIHS